ncbi:hypothetical protein DPMN_167783, partial [Dreissena polymorpha]
MEELESVLSENFGRTPANSQEVLCDETPLIDPEEPELFIATRVRDYLVRNEDAEDNESDQGEDVKETGDVHDDAFLNV